MDDQLPNCAPPTFPTTSECISSPALEAGRSHSDTLDGPPTDLFGREAVHVSPTVPPVSKPGMTIPATYGRKCFGLFEREREREREPLTIFGEQVEGAIRFGWLDRVFGNLEGEGFTVGACVLGAHSVGLPQIRQRMYWVAHSPGVRRPTHDLLESRQIGGASQPIGRLPSLEVAGTRWGVREGSERMPTLVRNFNGLSSILAGYGNAIVPQVAAAFVRAFLDSENA